MKKQTMDRANLFKFESITIKDDEVDKGMLPAKKINFATFIIFIFLELMLLLASYLYVDYSTAQFVTLTVIALVLARQIALDFAHHILLEIYNIPLIIASLFLPAMLFSSGSVVVSFIAGLSIFGFFLMFSLVSSYIAKKQAGIGGGDILFAFALGGFLQDFIIFISIFMASMFTLVLTFIYKDKKNVPMGPGLLLSFWLCLLYKEQIMQIVNRFLG